MSRSLLVGPFNRVEGDLEVRLELSDGQVAAARVTAPMYRGIERLLAGRPPLDALVIAPRICGICSVAQSSAAARALGDAMALAAPANGRIAADLILACENAADHLTHFYLFFMPDFAHRDYRERPWHDEAARRYKAMGGEVAKAASAARLRFLHVMGILAGKWPHSLALQPGGITKSIDLGERMRLLGILNEFRNYLEGQTFGDSLERIAALDSAAALQAWAAEKAPTAGDLRFFLTIADDLGLSQWGRGPARFLSFGGPGEAGGQWQDGKPGGLDLAGLREDLEYTWMDGGGLHPAVGVTEPKADKAEGYSWCKAPRLAGRSFEVGALARRMVAGHPLIRELVAASAGRGNVRDRVVARLLELALLVPAMENWVRLLGGQGAFCHSGDMVKKADGVGLVEAARGSLGHWLSVDGGRISRYQVVAPTTWNFSPRDAGGNPGPLEEALVGAPVGPGEDHPLIVQHIVRSFDPCMSCTVH